MNKRTILFLIFSSALISCNKMTIKNNVPIIQEDNFFMQAVCYADSGSTNVAAIITYKNVDLSSYTTRNDWNTSLYSYGNSSFFSSCKLIVNDNGSEKTYESADGRFNFPVSSMSGVDFEAVVSSRYKENVTVGLSRKNLVNIITFNDVPAIKSVTLSSCSFASGKIKSNFLIQAESSMDNWGVALFDDSGKELDYVSSDGNKMSGKISLSSYKSDASLDQSNFSATRKGIYFQPYAKVTLGGNAEKLYLGTMVPMDTIYNLSPSVKITKVTLDGTSTITDDNYNRSTSYTTYYNINGALFVDELDFVYMEGWVERLRTQKYDKISSSVSDGDGNYSTGILWNAPASSHQTRYSLALKSGDTYYPSSNNACFTLNSYTVSISLESASTSFSAAAKSPVKFGCSDYCLPVPLQNRN